MASTHRPRRQPRKTPGGSADSEANARRQSHPTDMSLRKMSPPSPPSSPTYYPSYAPQPPQTAKPSQRYLAAALKPLLIPIIVFGLPTWPFLAVTCAIPIIGVMAIPLLILLSVALLYAIAWLAYLFLAQPDLPAVWSSNRRWSFKNLAPFLPFSPLRCAKVDLAALRYVVTAVRIAFPAVFDWSYRRVMVLGTQKGARVVKEGILYGSPSSGKRLDVYLPPASASSPGGGLDDAAIRTERERAERLARTGRRFAPNLLEDGSALSGPNSAGAPVVVVVPSVFAPLSITSKRKLYLQLALRLRRMGYCVIVPDVTYYPESRIKSSIIDLRLVLRWTAKNCQRYGGDPAKIHVMGHGLSAHLVMLTVAQQAVVLSREGHLDRAYERQRGLEQWRGHAGRDGLADDGYGDEADDDEDADGYHAGREDDDEWKKSGEVGGSSRSPPKLTAATAADGDGADDGEASSPLAEDDVRPVEMQGSDRAGPSTAGAEAWVDEAALGPPASLYAGALTSTTRRFSNSNPAMRHHAAGRLGGVNGHRRPSRRTASPSAQILNSAGYLAATSEVGNGLKRVSIYEPDIEIPPLAGILLFSGISDVIKGFRSESEAGLEHLSSLRRATGPSHIQCLLHSPAHLLYAAKNILDVRLLPPKVLLVHGGRDTVVPVEQSTLLKTLLVGVGVENVKLRAYRHLGHAESLACMFLGMGKKSSRYTRQVLDDVAAFVGQ